MKSNVCMSLIIAASLTLVSSAAQAKFWKFGNHSKTVQTAQSVPTATTSAQAISEPPATTVNSDGTQLSKAQVKELAYQQRQQKHKLRIHLPFFYMGAF